MKLPEEITKVIDDLAMDLNNNYEDWVDKLRRKQAEKGKSLSAFNLGTYKFKNPYTQEVKAYTITIMLSGHEGGAGAQYDQATNRVIIFAPHNLYYNSFKNLLEHEFLHAMDPSLTDKFRSRDDEDRVPRKKVNEPVQLDDPHNYYSSGVEQRVYLSQLCKIIKERFWSEIRYNGPPRSKETTRKECGWLLNEVEKLIKFGECPKWLNDNIHRAVKIWKKQPDLWRKKIAPVLYQTLERCRRALAELNVEADPEAPMIPPGMDLR